MSPSDHPADPAGVALDVLAAAPLDGDDVAVLDRIAGLYERLDPVPPGLIDRITFGITLDALHAEIAELQSAPDLAGVRADGATAQTVTFTSASLTTMITITPVATETVRIDGWVAPGGGVTVELRTSTSVHSTTADADGRFVFTEVARGYAQFVLRQPAGVDAAPVVTPSIEL